SKVGSNPRRGRFVMHPEGIAAPSFTKCSLSRTDCRWHGFPTTVLANQRLGLTLRAWPNTLFAMTTVQAPIDLKKWIEQNADKFQPPVSNRYLYDGRDFFVMVIKGPNARNDFHLVDSEEYFYQLKGDIKVRIREGDRIVDHIV